MDFTHHKLTEEELLTKTIPGSTIWIHDRQKAKPWKGEVCKYYQAKFDGIRITIFKQANSSVLTVGRSVFGTKGNLLSLTSQLGYHWGFAGIIEKLPPFSSIDCELCVNGGTSSDVRTAMIAKSQGLGIIPFANPVLAGKVQEINTLDWVNPLIELTGTVEETMALALKLGYEGIMLKNGHYDSWFKLKEINTIDCVIMGYIDGEGKYDSQVGSIRIGVFNNDILEEIGCVSGMDDKTREELSEKDVGRVVEVSYQNLASQGRLRHPRFKCWRDDKPAEQCLYEQLL